MTKVLVADSMSEEGLQYLQEQESFQVVNRPGISPEELLRRFHYTE